MADEQLDGSLGNGLGALVDEVHALDVSEVVAHHSGDEALQLLHVEGAGDVGLIRGRQGPAPHRHRHTSYINTRRIQFRKDNSAHTTPWQ